MGIGYRNLLYSQEFENQSIIPITHSLDSDEFVIKIIDTGSQITDGITIDPLAVVFGTNELNEITIYLTSSESGQVILARPDGFTPRLISAAEIKFLQTAAIANIAGGISASILTVNSETDIPNRRQVSSSFGIKFVDGGGGGNIDINVDEAEIPVLSASNNFTGANIFSVISGTLMRNQAGASYLVAGDLALVDSSSGDQVIVSIDRQSLSGNFADPGASYIVVGLTASLANERALSSSFGNKIIDLGANANIEVNVDETEIPVLSASNTFTSPNIFTDGISGSLTHLDDGTSYLLEGEHVQITSGSNTGVTIAVAGDIGIWEEEIIVSQIANGINADLTATLTYEPISTGSVSVYVNTAFQIQHNPSGNYVLTGATNQTIHWLASSSLSAFDLDATDCILVKYLK